MARTGTGTGTKSSCYEDVKEEEYIDMDITTSATFIYYKKSSPPPPPPSSSPPPHNTTREFEFHNLTPLEKEPIASPADELFYKGKLLPLHLPPRIQMVERLLQAPKSSTSPLCNTTNTTPFASCTASPATSCYVSGELNADEYFFDCSAGIGMAGNEAGAKKSWAKKLKFIRQLNLGNKLKAPKAYLKSIFTNGGNKSAAVSDDRYATGTKNKEYSNGNGYLKAWKKNPFGAQIRRETTRCIASGTNYNNHPTKFGTGEEARSGHRRSFSSAIMRNSLNKSSFSSVSSSCSSSNCSSFSCASSAAAEPVLKRSSSANSEMENPIQGAIAYCKKSQQLASVRKSMSDTGFCFVTGIKIAADCDELEEEDICIV